MTSHKEYLDFVLEQLMATAGLGAAITHRAMMGEYLIYYQGKVMGGVYDDRFLLKPTEAGRRLLPDAEYELPYEGAKPMLVVEDIEDGELLGRLLPAMYEELPAPKPKKPRKAAKKAE